MIFVLFMMGCANSEVPAAEDVSWSNDESTDLNKELAIREKIDIRLFLDRHSDWKMQETGTGLYFYKYEEGKGESAKSRNVVQVQFDISLLDGTKCYSTGADDVVEEFVIDHSDIESGVQEGIKMMREGDKAKLIVPSHLAHGLVGDFDKIPPLTPIVVDIQLYKIVK